MQIDARRLERFEAGLDPQHPQRSVIPARLIGFGEISAIFVIGDAAQVVYKRMPLFATAEAADAYAAMYHEYCRRLTAAGLDLPESATAVVAVTGRPVVLYIAQRRLPGALVGHRLIHHLDAAGFEALVRAVVIALKRVWAANRAAREADDGVEIAVDGQISNWVRGAAGDAPASGLWYLDTSTPFMRDKGRHRLDPELLLQAAPVFLRWLVRWLFVADVMNRYYDPRQVLIDLAANLYKEQRPDLVGPAIGIINAAVGDAIAPLSVADVAAYYREDKFIWTLFLALRRLDRWLTTRLLRRRYEFILPGRIRR